MKQTFTCRYLFLLFVFLIQSCSTAVQEPGGFRRIDDIGKSPNDRREYRALVLENGLQVILVSDPESDKAAASMDIDAGSNSDPAAFEGLAHFLEHMLFLGTAKFPESGEYQEYIRYASDNPTYAEL